MTQTAALCDALLNGKVLSIMDGFKMFGITNLPREISRSVEQKFHVRVTRTSVVFTSVYGHKGVFFKYRLERTPENKDGVEKMRAYVSKQHIQEFRPVSAKQANFLFS